MKSSARQNLVKLLFFGVFWHACQLLGQARPTATGPGGYIAVGATLAAVHSPYGQHQLAGFTFFADANLTRRLGVEMESTHLPFNSEEGTHFNNYLMGPRISTASKVFRPYAKLLLGTSRFTYPYMLAKGSYFTLAPGLGIDVNTCRGRVFIRLVDFEYQDWPDFTFGSTHPYGLSTGVSIRIF